MKIEKDGIDFGDKKLLVFKTFTKTLSNFLTWGLFNIIAKSVIFYWAANYVFTSSHQIAILIPLYFLQISDTFLKCVSTEYEVRENE